MAKKILKTVKGAALGFLVGGPVGAAVGGAAGLGGSLLKKKKAAAATTATAAATERVMPLPDDEAVKRARMASMARQRGRSGRSSTILTGGSGSTLGGG